MKMTESQRAKQREYRRKRKEAGMCIYCSNPCSATSKTACAKHAAQKARTAAQWKLANPDKRAVYRKRWYVQNPERKSAQNAISHAIARGRLTRPDHCEKCLKRGRVQAHHPDYSKPLEVAWLCHDCHVRMHHGLSAAAHQTGEGK